MFKACPGVLRAHFKILKPASSFRAHQRQQSIVSQVEGLQRSLRRGLLLVQVDTNTVLLSSAACFAATALDVCKTHLVFREADIACHSWVVEHVPAHFRSSVADIFISDTFITLGLAGWTLASVVILFRQPAGSTRSLLLAWGLYLSAAGAVTKGDPPLVWSLKQLFHRMRPSTLHSTFSFPSGHTTAATFLIGGLLFTLLPAALAAKPEATSANRHELQHSQSVQPANAALAIWILATLATACGRILADAHWLSDTMAGAALGTLLVAVLSRTSRPDDSHTS